MTVSLLKPTPPRRSPAAPRELRLLREIAVNTIGGLIVTAIIAAAGFGFHAIRLVNHDKTPAPIVAAKSAPAPKPVAVHHAPAARAAMDQEPAAALAAVPRKTLNLLFMLVPFFVVVLALRVLVRTALGIR